VSTPAVILAAGFAIGIAILVYVVTWAIRSERNRDD